MTSSPPDNVEPAPESPPDRPAATPVVRDLSTLRRQAAAAAVARFLEDLAETAGAVPHRVVEGSAVAAQVRFTDEHLVRAVLRVDIGVSAPSRPAFEARLRDAGYAPGEGSGDIELMRIAGRRGRRPVHVLFEGSDAPPPSTHHPGSAEAIDERRRRFAGAFRPIVATWQCTIDRRSDDETVIAETREVHLVDAAPAATA